MATADESVSQTLEIWWVYLLQGIAAIVLGVMFLAAPDATLLTLVTFVGIYWFITGVLSFVRMFVDRSIPWFWSLLIGTVGVLAGIFVLRHPLLSSLAVPTTLVIVIGVQGLVMGAFEIVGGFKGDGIGSVLMGAINIIIGILLLSSPVMAALLVPLVLGVLLLVQGVGLLIWALRVHV